MENRVPKEEAAEFAKQHSWETTDVAEIAAKLAALPKKNEQRPRLAVITQGKGEVICVQAGKTRRYPVEQLTAAQLVDTNGAGDAFVGGYLSQLVQGASEAECVRCGLFAAKTIIQCSGCTLPPKCDYK